MLTFIEQDFATLPPEVIGFGGPLVVVGVAWLLLGQWLPQPAWGAAAIAAVASMLTGGLAGMLTDIDNRESALLAGVYAPVVYLVLLLFVGGVLALRRTPGDPTSDARDAWATRVVGGMGGAAVGSVVGVLLGVVVAFVFAVAVLLFSPGVTPGQRPQAAGSTMFDVVLALSMGGTGLLCLAIGVAVGWKTWIGRLVGAATGGVLGMLLGVVLPFNLWYVDDSFVFEVVLLVCLWGMGLLGSLLGATQGWNTPATRNVGRSALAVVGMVLVGAVLGFLGLLDDEHGGRTQKKPAPPEQDDPPPRT